MHNHRVRREWKAFAWPDITLNGFPFTIDTSTGRIMFVGSFAVSELSISSTNLSSQKHATLIKVNGAVCFSNLWPKFSMAILIGLHMFEAKAMHLQSMSIH